jgi:hypothetical protein
VMPAALKPLGAVTPPEISCQSISVMSVSKYYHQHTRSGGVGRRSPPRVQGAIPQLLVAAILPTSERIPKIIDIDSQNY